MVLATLFLALACHANAFGIREDGQIDQAAIRLGYKESEWDKVVETLEGYLRKKGDSRVSLEERIFAYKYLGVIAGLMVDSWHCHRCGPWDRGLFSD